MTRPLKQLTLRNIDAEIANALERMVREEGLSLNQAALKLLRSGLGPQTSAKQEPIGNSLDWFIGSWSDSDVSEFMEATESTREIDPGFWK
jgi:hypothetical protein